MPKRELGANLQRTHTAIRPGTRKLYITCADGGTGEGSWSFKSESFAAANPTAFQLT